MLRDGKKKHQLAFICCNLFNLLAFRLFKDVCIFFSLASKKIWENQVFDVEYRIPQWLENNEFLLQKTRMLHKIKLR